MKLISTTIAVLILVYIGLIVVAGSPVEKIDRMCAPFFLWPKKLFVSGARIFSPESVPKLERSFDSGYGTCRVYLWDILFEEDYRRAKAILEQQKESRQSD